MANVPLELSACRPCSRIVQVDYSSGRHRCNLKSKRKSNFSRLSESSVCFFEGSDVKYVSYSRLTHPLPCWLTHSPAHLETIQLSTLRTSSSFLVGKRRQASECCADGELIHARWLGSFLAGRTVLRLGQGSPQLGSGCRREGGQL